MSTLVIPARFNGPPGSANGGYACGLVAAPLGGVVQARLHVPPPLDAPMTLVVEGTQSTLQRDGETIASARVGALEAEAPPPPDLSAAAAAVDGFRGFHDHAFPTCFVCGPDRGEQDGLRLFPGPVQGAEIVACPWTPPEDLCADGEIPPEVVWAALDCPSFFGLGVEFDHPYLLGQMTADVPGPLPADHGWIVYGWRRGQSGRKHFAGAALADDTGVVHARAEHVWFDMAGR